MFGVGIVLVILAALLACAELYSLQKTIERLGNEVAALRSWAVDKIKDIRFMQDELQDKDKEISELRDKLNELYGEIQQKPPAS